MQNKTAQDQVSTEQWIERGRALQSQAVYEACAKLWTDTVNICKSLTSFSGGHHRLKHP